ncbi:hypothetical protein [Marinobacterium aestuariivivens]|uniref:NADH:quinone oxidoreductase/Mrp antiporter membrane subunit domain-containing protein n=1 Tax=Marinobacterium aestuariivivens TaxID=1698799 RepID=A0ABW1ZYK8_9GAMM
MLALPLALLCLLALFGALIPQPLADVFPLLPVFEVPAAVHLAVLAMPWLGLATGLLVWRYGGAWRRRLGDSWLARWWRAGWGFDALYDGLLVKPLLVLALLNRRDLLDQPVLLIDRLGRAGHAGLSALQSGRLRRYAAGIVVGAVLTLAVVTL